METYVIGEELAQEFRLFLELRKISARRVRVIEDLPGRHMATVVKIKQLVADEYGVEMSDLEAHDNRPIVAVPRQVAMFLCRKKTSLSYPEIAKLFGGKHHTTVMASVNKICDMLAVDQDLRYELNKIEAALIKVNA